MGKFKTNKSVRKRFKITAKKKILRRFVHQNHFNAKDSGNERRDKRGSKIIPAEYKKDITQLISLISF